MTEATAPSDPDILAAEYVLRLLDADETRAAEQRMLSDTAFRDLVYEWERYFTSLAVGFEEVRPPAIIKKRVLAAVNPPSRRRQRGLFGLLAAGTFAAVVGVALFSPALRTPQAPVPQYQAELVSESGDLVINAGFAPDQDVLVISRLSGAARPGRALELWLIAEGATAPVSLGVLGDAESVTIPVSAEIAGGLPTGTLAVSDEPLGGSPTGAPTGDVLAAAAVSAL